MSVFIYFKRFNKTAMQSQKEVSAHFTINKQI